MVPDPGRALVLLGGDGGLVGILVDGGGGDSWDKKTKSSSAQMVILSGEILGLQISKMGWTTVCGFDVGGVQAVCEVTWLNQGIS